jgi:tRNA A37 N6-isopentenylltransferase MiaA
MNGEQLTLVSQVLLQVEAEEIADRLNEAFDQDREQGKLRRISELVKQFRAEHRYA